MESETLRSPKAGPGQGRLFPTVSSRVSGSELCPAGADLPGSVPAAQVASTVLASPPRWIDVAGGVLPASRWRPATTVGDLHWMATPVTAALLTSVSETPSTAGWSLVPATGLTWQQAALVAAQLGGPLPTSAEWEWMAGAGVRRYPWGDEEPSTPGGRRANVRGFGPDAPTPVGAYPQGATPAGILDVAGNVWEWTSTPVPGGYVVRGGSYRALSLYARCAFANEVPAVLASPGIGLRVVRQP